MPTLVLDVDPAFRAALDAAMDRLGAPSEEAAIREAVQRLLSPDDAELARRREAIARFRGSIPNPDGTDWRREREWVHEGSED